MDLFTAANMQENAALASDHISEYWIRYFDADTLALLRHIVDKVYMEYLDDTCYPPWPDMFKAFNTIYPEEVRVVILGQDPYYNGNATGLAFACRQELSPSLQAIVKAIHLNFPELYSPDNSPRHPNSSMKLMHLVEQGVMLLNTALSVQAGKPGSHSHLWRDFTAGAIKAINRLPNIVWLLWGNDAKAYKDSINPKHTVLTYEHPAAAAHGKRDWLCPHFKMVNELFRNKPIIWF